MAKIQKMSLASENTLETEYFMPLNHFSNFSNFRGTQHFYVIFKDLFSTPKLEGEPDEFDSFEGGVSTATSKSAFWWSLVLSTL